MIDSQWLIPNGQGAARVPLGGQINSNCYCEKNFDLNWSFKDHQKSQKECGQNKFNLIKYRWTSPSTTPMWTSSVCASLFLSSHLLEESFAQRGDFSLLIADLSSGHHLFFCVVFLGFFASLIMDTLMFFKCFSFNTVKLLRYVSVTDHMVLGFEIVFFLFVIYYLVEEILEIKKVWYELWKSKTSFWLFSSSVIFRFLFFCDENVFPLWTHNWLGFDKRVTSAFLPQVQLDYFNEAWNVMDVLVIVFYF